METGLSSRRWIAPEIARPPVRRHPTSASHDALRGGKKLPAPGVPGRAAPAFGSRDFPWVFPGWCQGCASPDQGGPAALPASSGKGHFAESTGISTQRHFEHGVRCPIRVFSNALPDSAHRQNPERAAPASPCGRLTMSENPSVAGGPESHLLLLRFRAVIAVMWRRTPQRSGAAC